jgi:uncharacterized protein YjdB
MKNIFTLLIFTVFSFIFLNEIKAQCAITNNTLTPSGPTAICANNDAPSINGPAPNVVATITYSWLVSNTGLTGSYSLITGESGQNYSPGALSNSKWYKRIVNITCTPSGTDRDTSVALAITVTTAPSAGTLSGNQAICSNGNTSLTSTVSGGTWTSGTNSVATIVGGTGVVTGVAAGTSIMTYTVTGSGGCPNATATRTVTVTAAPTAGTLIGTQAICSNGNTTLTSSVSGGTWTSGTTSVATIVGGTGVVTGVAAGTSVMTYTVTGSGGCLNATATRAVAVTAAPTSGTLSGTQAICSNGNTTLTSTVSGGTWTSGTPSVATIVGGTGAVSGVAAGTSLMTYTVTGSGGCSNATATSTVTVTAAPTSGTLSGTQAICSNGNTTLTSSVSGGTWTSGTPSVATIVGGTGAVSGVAAGTSVMTYTVTGSGGCTNATATRTVTVTAAPTSGTLNGTQAICSNDNTILTSSVSGGTWTSGSTSVATIVGLTGNVTGVAAGTSVMTYTVSGSGGCANATATVTVTVNTKPFVNNQTVEICSENNFLLNLSNGNGNIIPASIRYSWSLPVNSNIIGLASANNVNSISGTLTNINYQNQNVVYQVTPSTALCTGLPFNVNVNVLRKPNIIAIDDQQICQGSSAQLYAADLFGNTNLLYNWSNSPDVNSLNFAYIPNPIASPQNSANYIVTVLDPTNSQCSSKDTVLVDVVPLPTISITSNNNSICSGESVNLSSNGVSASWYLGETLLSSNTTSIIVSPSSNSIYRASISNGICSSEDQIEITVNSTPNANSGEDISACAGNNTIQLYGSGGDQFNWSSQELIFNNVNQANPIIINPIAGNFEIVLAVSNNNGCSDLDTLQVSVTESPTVLLGIDQNVCQGSIVNLQANTNSTNLTFSWEPVNLLSSISAGSASLNSSLPGNYTIIVTAENASGCSSTDDINVNVNPIPVPSIIGSITICENSYWQEYHVNSSSQHGYTWNLDNGSVMSGQGTNTALVHWFNGTSGSIDVTEHIWETGCEANTSIDVSFSGLAPDPSTVTQLSSGSNILICSDSTFSIYNWGYESKTTPGALYVNTYTQYCQFPLLDPTSYYYFVDHGFDSECLTRSYFNTPPTVVGIEETTNKFGIILYPNPANEFVSINLDYLNSNQSLIEIFSLSGSLVYSTISVNEKMKAIDLSGFNKGLYLVKVLANDNIYHSRFIKD